MFTSCKQREEKKPDNQRLLFSDMPICIIINKRIEFLSPIIALKDFHLFLMMIIPLYIHTSICSLLIIYIRLLLLFYIYICFDESLSRLYQHKSQNKQKDKYQLLLFQRDVCMYMLSSAQLSTIRRKQHVVSRISVCC
jgi:hypothetical protein